MARVDLNELETRRTAHRFAGPLVRRYAHEIQGGAKRLVPRGDHRSGSGKNRPGATLHASITTTIRETPDSITARVGSPKNYAATVHQGSQAHPIRSRRGKMLAFEWDRGQFLVFGRGGNRRGRIMFFFRQVNHPGNKRPVRYLTTPMHMFGRIHGFITTSTPVGRTRLP